MFITLCGWEGEPQAWQRVLAAATMGTFMYKTNITVYKTGDQHQPIQFSLVSDYGTPLPLYTSTHGSGRRYYILLLKFFLFFFRQRISEMVLPTGNLYSSDGRI